MAEVKRSIVKTATIIGSPKVEISGLEADLATTDKKGYATGSVYVCVDTMNIYMFAQKFENGKEIEGEWKLV